MYRHRSKEIFLELHVDDIHRCGDPDAVKELANGLEKQLKIKAKQNLGVGSVYEHLVASDSEPRTAMSSGRRPSTSASSRNP